MSQNLRSFFSPEGVAIIGASVNTSKLSHGIFRNLLTFGYTGEVYPVNPSASEILGKKCYASIGDVPNPIDLAVIILPSQVIPQTLADIGERGISAAIIISGGFKEIGPGGLELEQECLRVARHYGIRIIGPNCVGTMNLKNGLNTTFIRGMPEKGGIGFLSQSGAVGGGVVDHIINKGIGFSHFVSLGNEMDITETDIIEVFGNDNDTRVIAAYIESIQDGQRFLKVCRKVVKKKPVVLLKAGQTNSGAKAVSSHTGSLAGSREAYSAAFEQAGIIEVYSVEDLLNVYQVFDQCPAPLGNQSVILTNAGGPAALTSDKLDENGIGLASLSKSTKNLLRQKLTSAAQVENPIDMLGGADENQYALALNTSLLDSNVDIAIPILVPQALVDPVKVANSIVEETKKTKKVVIACFMGRESVGQAFSVFNKSKIPVVDYPEKIGKSIGALYRYHGEIKKRKDPKMNPFRGVNTIKAQKIILNPVTKKINGEYETRPILDAYGIPLVPGIFAQDLSTAKKIAQKIGFPVAIKIVSDEILHKSETKAISLNIQDEFELVREWEKIVDTLRKKKNGININGFMVEKMSPKGQEVILGMKRDPNFGPVMMFGLGGIFVELFKDVSFRIAPLSKYDAINMIQDTKAGDFLTGFRNQKKMDIEAIVDCLLRLSQLTIDFPQIKEIEINPLMVFEFGRGVLALDCRMLLS